LCGIVVLFLAHNFDKEKTMGPTTRVSTLAAIALFGLSLGAVAAVWAAEDC